MFDEVYVMDSDGSNQTNLTNTAPRIQEWVMDIWTGEGGKRKEEG
jgi:hypothetical protein